MILHSVKVLGSDGSGSDSNVIRGVEWSVNHAKVHGWPAVMNLSLGGGFSRSLSLAICD